MVSFATLRFSDVFGDCGGPIERVESGALPVFGKPHHQVSAFLRRELAASGARAAPGLRADGTAADLSAVAACHMAISEALERWAFLAVSDGPLSRRYGFIEDGSEGGMAALPGLFRQPVRRLARLKALERHALVSWWDGRLPASRVVSPYDGAEAVRIHHDAGSGEVALLHRRTRAGVAYGHAAAASLAEALRKAAIELARAEAALAVHRAKGVLAAPADFLERRALYFAGEVGSEVFARRLATRPDKPPARWREIFDGEIPGPWSRWAAVWRCCVEMPTEEYLVPEADFFFW